MYDAMGPDGTKEDWNGLSFISISAHYLSGYHM